MTLWIDHVLLVVDDLDRAAERLFEEHGLASIPGGRHVGQGTANRVVPLGRDYIELIGVVDEDEASASVLGRWVADRLGGEGRPAAWCVAAPDLSSISARLGLSPIYMERTRPDGRTLSWHLAGLQEALAEPPLPFFISWLSANELHPGRATVAHRVTPRGISGLEVAGERARINEWLGRHELPVGVVAGEPAVRRVTVATDAGDIVLV
jgi:Glyoxalase-like domain